ncbi:hypothetical protein [Reichenbachiella sp.]|uniref:hypothetical protein n=1 Tax=Reichenbachiella sp. TaxID=2184521 RepID=UPI003B59D78A
MAIKKGFGYKDIDAVILGNVPLFISELTYKVTHEKSNRKGRGERIVSRHRGGKEYEVNMILGMEECVAIERALQTKYGADFDPTDLDPFDIPVVYDNGEQVVADIIKDFEWTEWGRGGSQGDLEINQTVPGICSDIKFSVPV